MNSKIKNYVTLLLLSLFIFGFAAANVLIPDGDISKTERRKLAQLPKITAADIISGKFMSDFEKYALDQFPFRDSFRSMKAFSNYYLFRRQDNNGIYIADGSAVKIEYPLDTSSVKHATDRFAYVYRKYMEGKDVNVYFSVIPDKNYFTAPKNGYLHIDYDALIRQMGDSMGFARYIDIFGMLDISDYYKTDTHWRQEKITDVAELLAESMDAEITSDYNKTRVNMPFYGVYYGQAALPMKPDGLCYLENEQINSCMVYDFETNTYISVYDTAKAGSDDPYEMFLSGSKSLLTIENPYAENGRELIMFRDSFGSSLAPLLVSGYAKISLADIRYISPELLEGFIDFENQDVLFIYSASVLNNSITLK